MSHCIKKISYKGLGKCVPVSKGYLWLVRDEITNVKGLTLEGKFVGNTNAILSPILSKNEKVEHGIKTRKPNGLRFWVKGGVVSPMILY